jgi:hypothetical protein
MDSENKLVGRPKLCPDQEDPLKLYAGRLSHRQMRIAKKIGGGNFSEGLRSALEHCATDIRFMDEAVVKHKK